MLKCEMVADCPRPVTHIDDKGFIYCTRHGEDRRSDGYHHCRKLRPHELNRLNRGEQVKSY